nr:RNA-directed DNA polymerase, eukaryota, reverse transcriptase zinc-binding domain protein [Tanacetum cinerariifolium]
MRTKKDQKVPQNLENYVHSINTVNNKSKKNVTKKNENINEKLSVNNQNTKNNGECDSVEKGIEVNNKKGMGNDGKKGFDGDLNGCNSENNSIKSVNCAGKVNNEEEEVGSKLDNKLMHVLAVISNNRENIVIFDDEIINLGSQKWSLTVCGQFIGCTVRFNEAMYHIRRMWHKFGLKDVIAENGIKRIGFARVLVDIDGEKGIKDRIEVMYKSKNISEGTKKTVNVEYSWILSICSHCKDNNGKTSKNNENVKENEKECQIGSTSKKNSSDGVLRSNKFTLPDSLVIEEDLAPNTNQRKIVNEVLSKESNDLEENKDVLKEDGDENNNVMRNEVEGSRGVYSQQKELRDCVSVKTEREMCDCKNKNSVMVSKRTERFGNKNKEEKNYRIAWKTDRVNESKRIERNFDLHSEGFQFTWTKSLRNPKCSTLKKLDRIMIPNGVQKRKGSFRFSNFITDKKDFLPTVRNVWDKSFEGHTMYKVMQKMKLLKKKMKQMSWENGNVFERVE